LRILASIFSLAVAIAVPASAAQITLTSSRTDIGPVVFFGSPPGSPTFTVDSVTLGFGPFGPLTQALTLTPGVTIAATLYNAALYPACTGCSGQSGSATVHGSLAATLSNLNTSASFSQTFQDVMGNAGATHTFTAAAGTLIMLSFGDGSVLTVQPLSLPATPLSTDVNNLTSQSISATFLLTAPTSIPEPGAVLLVGIGLITLGWKRSRAR
jgi:PEP-CTERM motif